METYEVHSGNLSLSSNKSKIDLDFVHKNLSESYWCKNIPKETVAKSITNSIALGLYLDENQIGFCRLITDFATFAYLADVFVTQENQGKGYGKWMMSVILKIPELSGLRRWMLATKDAHSLYLQSGWKPTENPESFMEITRKDIYQ